MFFQPPHFFLPLIKLSSVGGKPLVNLKKYMPCVCVMLWIKQIQNDNENPSSNIRH